MATDRVRVSSADPQTEAGYGGRYEEDSFDYPAPMPGTSGARRVAEPPAPADVPPPPESQVPAGEETDAARGSLGRFVTGRRGLLLPVAAGLVILVGLGAVLSRTGDTGSSTPGPGGTAQVSAPRSPAQLPSEPSAAASPPASAGGGAGLPVATPPQTGLNDDEDGGQEDQGREDGARSGDG